jgi:NADP-dependent 3-hydroxy acid dehydrogenase YdfG
MDGKVVAIAGGSSGIGEAAARRLAKAGAKVVIGARHTDRLATIAKEITGAGGRCRTRLTSRDSTDAFIALTVETFGWIGVLVNYASVMLAAPLAEARRDDWDRMIDLNIKGTLNGIGPYRRYWRRDRGTWS